MASYPPLDVPMKFAITSDLHFPKSISQQTILYSDSHYHDEFYDEFEQRIRQFSPMEIDAFIIVGDFYWDYTDFAPVPIIPPQNQWNFYNMFLYQLIAFRQWLDASIPLILIEGNHDPWFETCVYSENGTTFLNITHYIDFLIYHYKLSEFQAHKVVALLPQNTQDENRFEIGTSMYLLRNAGMLIGDAYIYGFPYHNQEQDPISWREFRDTMIKTYQRTVSQVHRVQKSESSPKIVACHHSQPKTPKKLYHDLACKGYQLQGLYWGHWHSVSSDYINSLKKNGNIVNVMPEMNGWQIVRVQT